MANEIWCKQVIHSGKRKNSLGAVKMRTCVSNNSLKFLIQCLISVGKATDVCRWKGSKNKKWPGLPCYYLVIGNFEYCIHPVLFKRLE